VGIVRGAARRRSAARALVDWDRWRSDRAKRSKKGDMSFECAFVRADSAFAEAERKDPSFVRPMVQRAILAHSRAQIAYSRWQLAFRRQLALDDTERVRHFVDMGSAHANRALVLDPTNADAFEVRGRLRSLAPSLIHGDTAARALMRRQAQSDLEQAVALNPRQAGAWASLAYLYAYSRSARDVLHAAQRALEADSLSSNVDMLLHMLFQQSYDAEQFTDAGQYCALLRKRFPKNEDSRFCQLMLLTTPQHPPAVMLAHELADSVIASAQGSGRDGIRRQASLLVAAVLARVRPPAHRSSRIAPAKWFGAPLQEHSPTPRVAIWHTTRRSFTHS
jgi:tetratricopeptide (TPR) repeat protein